MKRYKFSTYPNDEFYERGEVDAEIAELVDALKLQRALLDDAEIGDTAFIDGLINKHKKNPPVKEG